MSLLIRPIVSSITGTANQIAASSSINDVTLSIPATAILPGTLQTSGDTFINASTANLFMKDTSTGLKSSVTGIMNPQVNNSLRSTSFIAGLSGWSINEAGSAEFDNIDLRGAIHASIISYNQVQSTGGTLLVTKSAAKLKTDVVIPNAPTYGTTTVNIDVVDADGIAHASAQNFVANDILRLKDGLVGSTWFKVSSASDQTTFWRYTCTIQAGTANVTYRAGLGVVDYGLSGAGFIMLTADQTNAPYEQMATHAGTFSSADSAGSLVVTPQLRLGNLNGSYGYNTDIYGFGAGQYGAASKSWITVDQTNGIRLGNNTTVLGQWDISGNATFGQVAASRANLYWNNSNQRVEFRGSTAGTVVQSYIDTDGSFIAGAGVVKLNSSGLRIASLTSGGVGSQNIYWSAASGGSADIYHIYTSATKDSNFKISAYANASDTAGTTEVVISAQNDIGLGPTLSINTTGTTVGGGNANNSYFQFSGSNTFKGVGINGVPVNMLDVYGTGWFQSTLTAAALFTADRANIGGTTDPGAGKLHVANGIGTFGAIPYVVSTPGIYMGYDGTNGVISSVNSGVVGKPLKILGYPIEFHSSNDDTPWLKIFNSGGVNIGGTADPGAGDLLIEGQNAKGGVIYFGNDRTRYLQWNAGLGVYDFSGAPLYVNGVGWFKNAGTPESVVTAPVGSICSNTNGGAGTTLYVKESGTGNTGWIAK